MIEGRTSCSATQTVDGVLLVRNCECLNGSLQILVNVVPVWSRSTHRYVRAAFSVQCCVQYICAPWWPHPARNDNSPVQAAYSTRRSCCWCAASLTQSTLWSRCPSVHAIWYDRGPFFLFLSRIGWIVRRAEKADASCHAPTRIKGRRSNCGSSASALLHLK